LRVLRAQGWLVLVASSWIVRFSLGWGEMTREDREELQRHFSMVAAADAAHAETWEVRVRSDTAASAVQEVSLMLGPSRQERVVQISAATDLADRVRAAASW
jgi:hypothetical protein